MYKIIGADGKEYGPITAEQLRQWVAEGRANAQTKVLPEGSTEWKTLAEVPELAGAATIAPRPQPAYQPGGVAATDQVNGPAIGLMVTAGLNILVSLLRMLSGVVGFGMSSMQHTGNKEIDSIIAMSGTIGIVFGAVGLLCAILILLGGLKMRKLENRGLCLTAAILAVIPCTSPCCLVGIPLGIWALVVLSKPEVKSAFH
jgi:hypothetical protein